jgi:hypothetical protein
MGPVGVPPPLDEDEFEATEAAVVPWLFDWDVLGLTMVVTPAGLVLRRTFLVLGSLLSFLYFIRRFWNQILICRSDKQSACAISMRLRRVKYRLKWNSFSSSSIWWRVYAVL